jgi:hypothetical protein
MGDPSKTATKKAREQLERVDWEVLAPPLALELRTREDGTEVPRWEIITPVIRSMNDKMMKDVMKFLNRMLGLAIPVQTFLFGLFQALVNDNIRAAKRAGRYDRGIQAFQGQIVERRGAPDLLYRDPGTGGTLTIHPLVRDRGVTLASAVAELEYRLAVSAPSPTHPPRDRDSYRNTPLEARHLRYFYRSKRLHLGTRHLVCMAIPLDTRQCRIIRPGLGIFSVDQMWKNDLDHSYEVMTDLHELETMWRSEYELRLTECSHGPMCRSAATCTFGKRRFETNILTGNVLSIWKELEQITRDHPLLTKAEEKIRIHQFTLTDTGETLIGVIWPTILIEDLRRRLGEVRQTRDYDRRRYTVTGLVIQPTHPFPALTDPNFRRLRDLHTDWTRVPFTGVEEKMNMFGFAWREDDSGVVTHSRLPAITPGSVFEFILQHPTNADYRLKSMTTLSALTFLREKTPEYIAEEERFWREGLAKEAVRPVVEDIYRRYS